jgi:hypothetical protein
MTKEYDDVRLKSKGVYFMYPIPPYFSNPSNQEAYLYSNPFQDEIYNFAVHDVRQFGGPPSFPPPGQGPAFGPPSFPPPGQGPAAGPPPFAPPGQGPAAGPPTAPPPSFVPQQQVEAFAVDPGGIARCLFRYTYVWLRGFQQFWFYPTFVGRNSVSGYRWTGFRWVYFGISLRQIRSFTCY